MHCRCEINIDRWIIVCIVKKSKITLFGEFSFRLFQLRYFGDQAIHHLGIENITVGNFEIRLHMQN